MVATVMPPAAGPVLGVLGGMGPAATADFLAKVAKYTRAERDQDHIPTLVYSDTTTPDRSDAILHAGIDPLPALLHGIRFLNGAGVSAIAVPCNSAHFWISQMAEASSVPILNMVDAVASAVRRDHAGPFTLGLLSTDGTARSRIYHRHLAERGYSVVDLTDMGAANPVQAGIRAVKAGDMGKAREMLIGAANLLIGRGAQGIVYGCTDVSAALGLEPPGVGVPVWDSAVALARSCVVHFGKW